MSDDLPAGWTTAPVGTVASLQLGKKLDKARKLNGRPRPYLRNLNVRWGSFDTDDLTTMRFTDDESDITADSFVSEMQTSLGGEFRVHAIASPPGAPPPPSNDDDDDDDDDDDRGCVGPNGNAAAPGVEHYAAATVTNGLTFSICTADWSALFSELAKAVGDSAPLPC